MKTTVEIRKSPLEETRRVASREGTTVRVPIEKGVRRIITERKKKRPFRLRRGRFKNHAGGLALDIKVKCLSAVSSQERMRIQF